MKAQERLVQQEFGSSTSIEDPGLGDNIVRLLKESISSTKHLAGRPICLTETTKLVKA
jgi:hypothetical protein